MGVEQAILETAAKKTKFRTSDVVRYLKDEVSRQFVSSVTSNLVKQGKLIKSGSTKSAFYVLPKNAEVLGNTIKKRLTVSGLKEHEVLDNIRKQTTFIETLKENVFSIFGYAFSEMLNNVIDHSNSEFVEVEVERKKEALNFIVNDFGVGVFKNVIKERKLNSELSTI